MPAKTATACTAPHHHVHDASDFVAVVERVSRERGLRLTPIRANVLKLIAEAGKPVKAYELLEWVRNGKGVGADAAAWIGGGLGEIFGGPFVDRAGS